MSTTTTTSQIIGTLSLKEIKTSSLTESFGSRDYGNILWRTATFALMDTTVFHVVDGVMREFLDLTKVVVSRNYIQECDESLFNRKYVFCIILGKNNSGGTSMYFAAKNSSERRAWVHMLKLACTEKLLGVDSRPFRVYRALALRIIEGRNTFGDLYCEVFIGNDRKVRTPLRKDGDHFWRQDYVFVDLYSLRHGVCLILMSQGRLKDTEVGRVLLTQHMLRAGETEAWYPLSNETSAPASGDLKLKFKYEEDVVLSLEQYKPILDVMTVSTDLVYELANAASDLEYISNLILCIHDSQGNGIRWLEYLLDNEIAKTDDANVLFRGNSILTKAVDSFMKLVGMDYLEFVLGDILREIVNGEMSCEIDPTRLDKKDSLEANWRTLNQYAKLIWKRIEDSKNEIPGEMRHIFSYIQQQVLKKYGSASSKTQMVRYTSVSGFLFLRLFCPCILNPKLFGITSGMPEICLSTF